MNDKKMKKKMKKKKKKKKKNNNNNNKKNKKKSGVFRCDRDPYVIEGPSDQRSYVSEGLKLKTQ